MAGNWQRWIKRAGRLCAVFVVVSLFYMVFVHTGPQPPPKIGSDAYFKAKAQTEWAELCASTDCDRFPLGYTTYVFGPEIYYFPQDATMTERPPNRYAGGVKPGGYMDVSDAGLLLRSFSNGPNLIISYCCHYLLSFYGLADGFPDFRADRKGNRMSPARLMISSYDRPGRDNKVKRHFDIEYESNNPPSISAVLTQDQLSYNDDFWLMEVRAPNENGIWGFDVLSKRPLLNGRYVYGGCGKLCSFHTLSFAEDINNQLPHISLLWFTLTGKNAFLCAPEDLEGGCNPAPEVFDRVPLMLSLVEDMFEAAKIHPEDRK